MLIDSTSNILPKVYQVLIIEDSEADFELYQSFFAKDQVYYYYIHYVETGKEALQLLLREKPDLILLDFSLPDMDGLLLIENIQKVPNLQQIPLIMLTGQGNEVIARQAMKKNIQDYFIKGDLDFHKFIQAIHQVIEIIENQQFSLKINRIDVLLIDHKISDLELYTKFLQSSYQAVFNVNIATTGMAALEFLANYTVDVILTNYQLSDMTGLELLKKIKTSSQFDNISIIIMTGHGNQKLVVDVMKNGASDYLIKQSITSENLQKTLEEAVYNNRLSSQSNKIQFQKNLLSKISANIRTFIDLNDIIQTSVLEVKKYLQCQRVFIYRFDQIGEGKVVGEAVDKYFTPVLGLSIKNDFFTDGKNISECINNWSKQTINDVQEANLDTYHRQLLESLQIKSMAYMPIIIENLDNSLWGLLVVNFCDKLHFWEQNEIRFLNEITLQIAIGIHQGLLVEELQREIRQRKEAENLLDETNNKLAKLVEERTAILQREQSRLSESQKIAHIGSFEYDIATDQAIWSEETYHIYQYDPHLPPPSNQEFMSAFHPEDLPKYLAVLAEVSQEPLPFDIEYRFQCADGTLKYINSRGKSVIDHEGKIKSLIGVAIDVTEQKKIDLKIQEQAERLKLIIEGTEMATWDWDISNNQLLWSERHFEILGLPYSGNEQGDFTVFQERIHPEDRQRVLELYHQRLQDRQIYKKEYRIIRADNQKVVWLGALGNFMADQTGKTNRSFGVLFDITERKEAEIALQQTYNELVQSEQRFRRLIEAVSQAVWATDGNGLVVKALPSWQKLTGQTDQEILGLGCIDAIHPDDQNMVTQMWQEAQIVPTHFDCEYRLRNVEGVYRYYHSKGLPLFNEQNEVYEWIGVATDITEIKQAQQILEEANTFLEKRVLERTIALEKEIAERMAIEEELQQATADLKRSNQELSQFAYITSHDLQEPLRAIINFAQKIMTNYHGRLDNKADMYLEFVIDGANRMQQLIKDILAYSRVGRMESKWQTINLNNLLTKVCHDLQVTIRETQATITIAPLPLIQGDHSQLSLLWQNLISNSLKYHSDRPIQIEIFVPDYDRREISLGDSKTNLDSYEILAIRDNGIGIAPEYSDRIFTIFQRLHTSDEYPGTGLGLAICQKIIEQHNGKIWVQSELGSGSTFYLMLLSAKMQSDWS